MLPPRIDSGDGSATKVRRRAGTREWRDCRRVETLGGTWIRSSFQNKVCHVLYLLWRHVIAYIIG